MSIERKAEKRSLYCDMRDDDKEMDTMDKWDEDKLKEVVEKKHGGGGSRPTTDIVSRVNNQLGFAEKRLSKVAQNFVQE